MNQNELASLYMSRLDSDIRALEEKIHQSAGQVGITQTDIDSQYKTIAFDTYDLGFCVIIGCLGGMFNTSEEVKSYLSKIHDDASDKSPKTLIGKLLHHKHDPIDIPEGSNRFIMRNSEAGVAPGFHRLRWGHDILSIDNDNPFELMIEKHGILKGILSTSQHLIADLFSKNGMPLPGSSFADFIDLDGDGKNWFQEFSRQAAKGTNVNMITAYQDLFTVNAQDLSTYGTIKALHLTYVKSRGIDDAVRNKQILLLSYFFAFYTAVGKNYASKGIPYVNWPILGGMILTFCSFIIKSYAAIKELEEITQSLQAKNESLRQEIFQYGETLKTHDDAIKYIEELNNTERGYHRFNNRFNMKGGQ